MIEIQDIFCDGKAIIAIVPSDSTNKHEKLIMWWTICQEKTTEVKLFRYLKKGKKWEIFMQKVQKVQLKYQNKAARDVCQLQNYCLCIHKMAQVMPGVTS